jgi:hypothetical protein
VLGAPQIHAFRPSRNLRLSRCFRASCCLWPSRGFQLGRSLRPAHDGRHHHLDGCELLAHGRFTLQLEECLHLAHRGAATHEVSSTLAAQHELERSDQDALAGARFTGQHIQTRTELQLDRVDDCEVLDSQAAKHDSQPNIAPARALFK